MRKDGLEESEEEKRGSEKRKETKRKEARQIEERERERPSRAKAKLTWTHSHRKGSHCVSFSPVLVPLSSFFFLHHFPLSFPLVSFLLSSLLLSHCSWAFPCLFSLALSIFFVPFFAPPDSDTAQFFSPFPSCSVLLFTLFVSPLLFLSQRVQTHVFSSLLFSSCPCSLLNSFSCLKQRERRERK